jgi:cytochrome c553
MPNCSHRRARSWQAALLVLGAWLLVATASTAHATMDEEFFEQRIRPVLADVCFRCHGDTKAAGGLRVDSRESLLRGGDSGPAIVPGKPAESLLVRAIQHADDVSAMPVDGALESKQIEAIVSWIAAGALWPAATARFESAKHWAFAPVQAVPLPTVADQAWVKTSLDAFIRAQQEAAGVSPGPAADRRTLIRRATFDLTGLPPTPAEVATFEADASPAAFATVVERLLHSPHYGEQWGRHWLDVVRYADTAGENTDHPLPHAWRYRNWVIEAFNANLPYNEFIRRQIAGDLLAAEGPTDEYEDRVIATGYLAIARRFGHDIDQDVHLTIEDTIDTMCKSVLGLTVACARCHDHKYDPLTAADYYGLYGILASTKFAFPGCEPKQQPRDLVPLVAPAEFERKYKPLTDQIAALDAELAGLAESQLQEARALQQAARAHATVLSAGDLADATEAELVVGAKAPLEQIAVRRGDVLQLAIGPRGNHGADSTRVELVIEEIGQGGRRWSSHELVNGFAEGHPHADSHGNALSWCFLDAHDGFAFLSESLDMVNGRRELKACRAGETPTVLVNTSDQPVDVWTRLPGKSFFMHPGPNGPVALAWLCPFDGAVRVSGKIADVHAGGDGVSWTLDHFSTGQAENDLAAQYAKGAQTIQSVHAATARRSELAAQVVMPVGYAVTEGEPRDAKIQKRGDPADLGDAVPRKFLEVLGGERVQNTSTSGRQELANWLTAPSNPLTARVFVNRVWQWHFGRGLVATPNDFGTRGTPATHPELLDHLAAEFVASGWDVRALHRRILLSATYQLASPQTQDNSVATPSDLYATFTRRRLTAEELRDALLAVTGELDAAPGGPHPFPAESTWSFTQHNPFADEYETLGRSVYLMQKRNRRGRFFRLFDGADPNASTPLRDVTTVPTQALFFMNDPFVHERAAKLSLLICGQTGDDRQRLELAHRQLFGRAASEAELSEGIAFLSEYAGGLQESEATRRNELAWSAYARVLLSSNEFLYVD